MIKKKHAAMAYEPLKSELQINEQDGDIEGRRELPDFGAPIVPVTQQQHGARYLDQEEELNDEDTVHLLQEDSEIEEQSEIETKEHDGMLRDGTPPAGARVADKKTYKIIRYVLGIGVFVLLFSFLAAAVTMIAIAPSCKNTNELKWWKTTVIYQCYPKSFRDTDKSGTGDLKGIIEKIDYFVDIGVDTVWLNPIFLSPQKDNGYDISNYTDVDPLYGTMDDLKSLLKEMKSRGLHLLLDFVPNHTSDEHPWFRESRSNTSNPKRDWYIWADGKDDGPPNNWISLFGGSAWTLDNTTGQYYFHQFGDFQPDLNYRNPDVVKEMENVVRFWLDLGVDGFRIDAVIFLLEDPLLPDEVPNPSYSGPNCTGNIRNPDCYGSLVHNYTSNYHGIHDIIKGWRKVVDSFDDRFIVGEVYDPVEEVMTYYGENDDEFHFPFNFLLLGLSNWTGFSVSQNVSSWLDNMPNNSWPNWVLGNHDNPRIANKVGNYLARAVNVLLLTLPGTPTSYYGEEIFMTDVYIPPSKIHDLTGRDKERTPMQWNKDTNAGFTSPGVDPWLPVATNFTQYNVEVERSDNTSMLSLYKQLVYLRSNDSFKYTGYELVANTTEVYAFRRFYNRSTDEYIVVVNFGEASIDANVNSTTVADLKDPTIVLSSNLNRTGNVTLASVSLASGEAVVIKGSRPGLSCQ